MAKGRKEKDEQRERKLTLLGLVLGIVLTLLEIVGAILELVLKD